MQQFVNIGSGEKLTDSRLEIVNNDLTIMSCNSGTSFPTTNLQVGMLCLRTDLNQLFQLEDMNPTWTLVFDLNKSATNQEYVDARDATKVDISQVVSAVAPGKLLLLDSSGNLPASVTGNAATAAKLLTARTIAANGDVSGTATSFDGSGNIIIPTALVASGVTAGTYTLATITVDSKGRVTSASSGSPPTYVVAELLATCGYRKWSDGFIEQWGTNSSGTVTFPIAFPNACCAITLAEMGTNGDQGWATETKVRSRSTTNFVTMGDTWNQLNWHAFGY